MASRVGAGLGAGVPSRPVKKNKKKEKEKKESPTLYFFPSSNSKLLPLSPSPSSSSTKMLLNAAPSARLVRSTPSSTFRSAAAVAAARAAPTPSPSLRSAAPAARGSSVVVRASFAGYPDPDFIAETLERFPEASWRMHEK